MELPCPAHGVRPSSITDLKAWDLPPIPNSRNLAGMPNETTLPDLKTVLSRDYDETSSPQTDEEIFVRRQSLLSLQSLPPTDPGLSHRTGTTTRSSTDSIMRAASESSSVGGFGRGRSPSVSVADDEKRREAAEGLFVLGKSDYVRAPPSDARGRESTFDRRRSIVSEREEPEPLLQLFAKAHPWVSGKINGSINAYANTKNNSPRFVQYGANLVERNITIPVVSTVSSVGRMTGVESGLRRYYGGSRDGRESRSSRNGANGEVRDVDMQSSHESPKTVPMRDSVDNNIEQLPPYFPSKLPSYREEASPSATNRELQRPEHNRSWSTQVFVMTSGLGVALSDGSRRSLVYCLGMLGQAAQHVQTLTDALRMVLEQYDNARDAWRRQHNDALEKGEAHPATPEQDEAARILAEIIKKHSDDIWKTLKNVVNYVSNSAGGALPANARHFVRSQLMSLPQRWVVASESEVGDSETSRNARRMIAFATEGLDMMSQVSYTMRLTLDSAEKWLAGVGRRQYDSTPHDTEKEDYDHDMPDAGEPDDVFEKV